PDRWSLDILCFPAGTRDRVRLQLDYHRPIRAAGPPTGTRAFGVRRIVPRKARRVLSAMAVQYGQTHLDSDDFFPTTAPAIGHPRAQREPIGNRLAFDHSEVLVRAIG